jgi:hypothetical protein
VAFGFGAGVAFGVDVAFGDAFFFGVDFAFGERVGDGVDTGEVATNAGEGAEAGGGGTNACSVADPQAAQAKRITRISRRIPAPPVLNCLQ